MNKKRMDKPQETKWELSATCGMMGADLDFDFLESMTINELEHFVGNIVMAYKMCQEVLVAKMQEKLHENV